MFSLDLHALVGWIGVTLIFLTYMLRSHHWIREEPHQWLNVIGAILYGIDLYVRETWEGVFLEIAWFFIAASALVGLRYKNRKRTSLDRHR